MGNRINGVGESKSTRYKEEFFALCLGYHMQRECRSITKLQMSKPYFHLDLNAGSGFNGVSRTVGTPVLFLRQAAKHRDIDIQATFVESNPATVEALRGFLRSKFSPSLTNGSLFGLNRSFDIVRGDNETILSRFPQFVTRLDRPQFARGSIICDPNGWARSGGAVNLETLATVCGSLPNLAVLIFFPYALAKMVTGWADNAPDRKATLRKVRDFLPLRPHWLISEPRGGKVYLFGTAIKTPEGSEHVPAHYHATARGQQIIDTCDTIRDRSKAIASRRALEIASAC